MLVSNVATSLPLPGRSFAYSAKSAATGGRTSSPDGGGSFFTASGGGSAVLFDGGVCPPGSLFGGGGWVSLDLGLCSQPTASVRRRTAARRWVRIAPRPWRKRTF